MATSEENFKDALNSILSAIVELKNANKQDIDEIKAIINRQDLSKFPAGALVDKNHCQLAVNGIEKTIKDAYAKLEKELKEDQEAFNKSINRKLNWAYLIGILALGGIGSVVGFIATQVFNSNVPI